MMFSFLLTFLFSFQIAQAKAPFQSSEKIEFLPAKESKFAGFGKIPEFRGIISRTQNQDSISKNVDLYEFKSDKGPQLESQQCTDIAQRIFGPLDKISLKSEKMEMLTSTSKGKICSLKLKDEDPQAQLKSRNLYVFRLHLKTYALVFRFPYEMTSEEKEESLKFIESLR